MHSINLTLPGTKLYFGSKRAHLGARSSHRLYSFCSFVASFPVHSAGAKLRVSSLSVWQPRRRHTSCRQLPSHSTCMTYCRVESSDLVELCERLKPELPRAGSLLISARNVIAGRVEGKFYTDKWPGFSTVVFQCLQPRLSDECDLYCYTTSKQQLCCVLEQAHLVTKGQWQYIQIVEDDDSAVTDYVVRNIRSDGEALLGQLPAASAECPEGYRLGRLAVEHSTYISSQAGQWVNSLGRPAGVVKEYFKHCIQRLPSVAVYCDYVPITPVAWQIQHSLNGTLGSLFTVEGHRRKGLATVAAREVCEVIIAQGDTPMSSIQDGSSSVKLHSKLGFQHVGNVKDVYLHINR